MTPAPNEMPEEIWVRHAQCGKNSKGERLSAVENIPSSTRDHGRIKYIRSDLARTSQWRDISTMPQDGRVILLFIPHSEWQIVTFKTQENITATCLGATHWYDLPAPPTKDLAAAGKEKQ